MQYFSTNRSTPKADFRTATLKGQPDDNGLYFPETIPQLSADFLNSFHEMPNEQIAYQTIKPYIGDTIDEETLLNICKETVDFSFPLVEISDRVSTLELFHGPTLAFKDVGARFMSRCLRHFSQERKEKTIVIVATSGDTGGAVAAGFHGVDGVDVVILYPKDKVSRVQEFQLTTLGGNVIALEVRGTFDDCQALAKRALADAELQNEVFLTSANSINVARWLPQQFYYFFALKQWNGEPPVFSVPSGNFGNICAGILAHVSGMPASGFVAACNANAAVPDFLTTGEYKSRTSVSTLSNAMDVGDPSNFVRLLEIFDHEFPRLKHNLSAVSIGDDETKSTMRSVYDQTGYILDPHGAVAYNALVNHLENHPHQQGIFLETAHPVKFDSVGEILGSSGEIPSSLASLFKQEKLATEIEVDYQAVKEIILSRI